MGKSKPTPLDFETFISRVYETTNIRTQNQLAAVLGLHRSAVTQAKRNDRVPRQWIYRLAEACQVDAGRLLDGRACNEPPIVWVPKVKARLSAGGGSFETEDRTKNSLPFDRRLIQHLGASAEMVLMDVVGDSMEPNIKAGDAVMIDRSQADVVAGGIYAVGIDDTIMVKRLEKRPGQLVLISDNSAYDPVFIDSGAETVRILGRVVWLGRRMI